MRTTPAPTPPTKSTSPKIVAIIFPPPNFFFGVAITGGKSEGVVGKVVDVGVAGGVGVADVIGDPVGVGVAGTFMKSGRGGRSVC